MSYWNLARMPSIPLSSRVPSASKYRKLVPVARRRMFPHGSSPRSSSLGTGSGAESCNFAERSSCLWKAVSFSSGLRQTSPVSSRWRTLSMQYDTLNAPAFRSLGSAYGMRTGVSFSSESVNMDLNERINPRAKKPLPWIAEYGEGRRDRVKGRAATKNNMTSWDRSAERFFDRDGQKMGKDKRSSLDFEDKNSAKVEIVKEEEYEDDIERVENPKRYRIKDKYERFVDRASRFERPEVRQWNQQEAWGRKAWKEAAETSVLKLVGQGVYGVGPVLAALTAGRREFFALYAQEGLDLSGNNKKKKDKKGVERVFQIAEKIGLKVVEASKHDLNMAVENRPHQGLVLDASPLEMVSIRELESIPISGRKDPVWVALDEVSDPQNLGAIIRSAYYFGAEGVVLCAKNSAPLSGVVSKASAGSLELIELRSCKNMMQFLSSSVENGWRVLGGSVSPKAIPLTEVEAGEPTVLVLGSEGTGLRPLVERSCTDLIKVPGYTNGFAGETGAYVHEGDENHLGQDLRSFLAVESLNVSVAAGVLLYHLVRSSVHLEAQKHNNSCV